MILKRLQIKGGGKYPPADLNTNDMRVYQFVIDKADGDCWRIEVLAHKDCNAVFAAMVDVGPYCVIRKEPRKSRVASVTDAG